MGQIWNNILSHVTMRKYMINLEILKLEKGLEEIVWSFYFSNEEIHESDPDA